MTREADVTIGPLTLARDEADQASYVTIDPPTA